QGGVRSEQLERQILKPLVGLAPENLLERALRPRVAAAQQRREAAIAAQTEQLDLDMRLRQALADQRIAQRVRARGMLAQELHQLRQAAPDLALEDERPHGAALVLHDAHRDAPAGARRSEQVLGGHADVLEEDLAELGVVGHLPQRPHGDAWRLHVDQQQAEALLLRTGRLRAGEQEAAIGDVRMAGPDLLAVDDVRVATTLGPGAEARQVGARARLREALAPELVAVHHRREEALALGGRAVREQRGADEIDVGLRRRTGRADLVERLVEEPALHDGGAATALLARPGDRRPAT